MTSLALRPLLSGALVATVLLTAAILLFGSPLEVRASNIPPDARAVLVADGSELTLLSEALVEGQASRGNLSLEPLSWESEDLDARLKLAGEPIVVVATGGPFRLESLAQIERRRKKVKEQNLADYLTNSASSLERLGGGSALLVLVEVPPGSAKKRRRPTLVERAIAGLQEQCAATSGCSVVLSHASEAEQNEEASTAGIPADFHSQLSGSLEWVEVVPVVSPWDAEGRLVEPTVLSEERLLIHESQARNKQVRFWAFLPQAESPGQLFPVLYLLHGATGDYGDWRTHAKADLLDLASTYGLIIVTPDGDDYGWYLDSPMETGSQLETYFMKELVPFVERGAGLPVAAGARSRAIAGLSMGGHGAVTLALRNPGSFRTASSMSGILDITTHPKSWQIAQRLGALQEHRSRWEGHSAAYLLRSEAEPNLPLLLACGDTDRAAWAENQALHEELTAAGRDHEWRTSDAGHSWTYWRGELPEHVAFAAEYLRGDGVRPRPPTDEVVEPGSPAPEKPAAEKGK